MIKDTYDILLKELNHHGVKICDRFTCEYIYNGKTIKTDIKTKIKLLKKQFNDNLEIFKELMLKVSIIINNCETNFVKESPIDEKNIKLFISSIKETYSLLCFITENSNILYKFSQENNILEKIRKCLNEDYLKFSKETILVLPDIKISLDWIFRRNNKLAYISSLLNIIIKYNKKRISQIIIKEAKGTGGPWSNLDLPMLERCFAWDDIEEEVRGRDKDLRNQRRYKMGLENYNKAEVGEGYYWREMRNEPYSWYNSAEDSPYPHLKPGTWR
jgi:hypothetical protein